MKYAMRVTNNNGDWAILFLTKSLDDYHHTFLEINHPRIGLVPGNQKHIDGFDRDIVFKKIQEGANIFKSYSETKKICSWANLGECVDYNFELVTCTPISQIECMLEIRRSNNSTFLKARKAYEKKAARFRYKRLTPENTRKKTKFESLRTECEDNRKRN